MTLQSIVELLGKVFKVVIEKFDNFDRIYIVYLIQNISNTIPMMKKKVISRPRLLVALGYRSQQKGLS